jgi:hypothetical protein
MTPTRRLGRTSVARRTRSVASSRQSIWPSPWSTFRSPERTSKPPRRSPTPPAQMSSGQPPRWPRHRTPGATGRSRPPTWSPATAPPTSLESCSNSTPSAKSLADRSAKLLRPPPRPQETCFGETRGVSTPLTASRPTSASTKRTREQQPTRRCSDGEVRESPAEACAAARSQETHERTALGAGGVIC